MLFSTVAPSPLVGSSRNHRSLFNASTTPGTGTLGGVSQQLPPLVTGSANRYRLDTPAGRDEKSYVGQKSEPDSAGPLRTMIPVNTGTDDLSKSIHDYEKGDSYFPPPLELGIPRTE